MRIATVCNQIILCRGGISPHGYVRWYSEREFLSEDYRLLIELPFKIEDLVVWSDFEIPSQYLDFPKVRLRRKQNGFDHKVPKSSSDTTDCYDLTARGVVQRRINELRIPTDFSGYICDAGKLNCVIHKGKKYVCEQHLRHPDVVFNGICPFSNCTMDTHVHRYLTEEHKKSLLRRLE